MGIKKLKGWLKEGSKEQPDVPLEYSTTKRSDEEGGGEDPLGEGKQWFLLLNQGDRLKAVVGLRMMTGHDYLQAYLH